MSEFPEATGGTNEVQVGGLNTTDPRFASYKSYSGCLSSKLLKSCLIIFIYFCIDVFVEVNGHAMKPLEEYMLFTKTGSEKIDVQNSAGIRSAQCAVFDTITKRLGPSMNYSLARLNMNLVGICIKS